MLHKLFLLLFPILFSVTGCSTKPHALTFPEDSPKNGLNTVYLTNHGRHTGLTVPSRNITPLLPELRQRFGNVHYLEFGWGDRVFYQSEADTIWLKLRAVFWPTATVMHIVGVPKSPKTFFPDSEVIKLDFNDRQMAYLNKFLVSSFHHNESGNIVPLKKGLYGDSMFYEGAGSYHLFNTCNKWTAKGLQSTGMDISPMFKLSAASVMDAVKVEKGPK